MLDKIVNRLLYHGRRLDTQAIMLRVLPSAG